MADWFCSPYSALLLFLPESVRKPQLAEKVLARALNLLKNLHDRTHLEGPLLAAYQSLNNSRKVAHYDTLDGADVMQSQLVE